MNLIFLFNEGGIFITSRNKLSKMNTHFCIEAKMDAYFVLRVFKQYFTNNCRQNKIIIQDCILHIMKMHEGIQNINLCIKRIKLLVVQNYICVRNTQVIHLHSVTFQLYQNYIKIFRFTSCEVYDQSCDIMQPIAAISCTAKVWICSIV